MYFHEIHHFDSTTRSNITIPNLAFGAARFTASEYRKRGLASNLNPVFERRPLKIGVDSAWDQIPTHGMLAQRHSPGYEVTGQPGCSSTRLDKHLPSTEPDSDASAPFPISKDLKQ